MIIEEYQKKEIRAAESLRKKRIDFFLKIAAEKWPQFNLEKLSKDIISHDAIVYRVTLPEKDANGEPYIYPGSIIFGLHYPYAIVAGGNVMGHIINDLSEAVTAFDNMFIQLRDKLPVFDCLQSWLVAIQNAMLSPIDGVVFEASYKTSESISRKISRSFLKYEIQEVLYQIRIMDNFLKEQGNDPRLRFLLSDKYETPLDFE